MKAIVVKDVTKDFGPLPVLKGVNLEVEQGEIFTLLGANGAGKSTLINILTTLSQPTAGTVAIMGLDPRTAGNQVRRLMSLNAQATTLDGEFTGAENLRLIARLRGVNDVPAEIEGLAQRLDLSSFLNRKVKTYSGGMRRRLDLAMSLLGNPQLIFLDEPTTGVDPQNRLALWQMIRELRDAGKTVFLTTQYLDEADALSDHIAFIHDGVIVKSGTPAAIKQRVTATYTLQVAPADEAVATATLGAAGITFTPTEHGLSLTAKQGEPALTALLDAGVTVTHYDQDKTDLESVFLNVTKEAVHANL